MRNYRGRFNISSPSNASVDQIVDQIESRNEFGARRFPQPSFSFSLVQESYYGLSGLPSFWCCGTDTPPLRGPAGGLQHRPGGAVHGGGVRRMPGGGRGGGEHGRSGAGAGQRVRGAAVEEREIRSHLHPRLRDGAGVTPGPGPLLRLLQRRAAASVARLPDPGKVALASRHHGVTSRNGRC